jgi:type IV pilus assembly protein PilM
MGESIWKKEISFKRKPKDEPVVAELVVAAEPDQPKQSVWKKEVSFGRKPKEPKVESEPKQSLWKKEVSFSRKKKDEDAVARLVELATKTVAPDFDSTPPPEPVASPTHVAEAVLAAEPVAESADVHPVELLPVDEPVAVVPPVAIAPPVAEVAPVAPAPVFEVPAPVEIAPPVAEVAPVAPAPVFEVPAPTEPAPIVELPTPVEQPAPLDPAAYAPPPVEQSAYVAPHVEAGPVEQWMEPVQAEPWLAEPELPPAPEPATQVVVHPPVPALELPPLPESKQPFWKKELSFGRKSKQKQGEASAVQAPAATSVVHPPVTAAELPPLPELKQPFWKKELSFGRKSKDKHAGASAVQAPVAAPGVHPPVPAAEMSPLPEAKVPFWKKEIGGSKKPKVEAEKAPRAKKALSFSLPSLSLPALSRGGKGGGHQVKRLVGLKVGGSQLAAARIANNGAAELLQLVRADLEPGVVVAGELRDPDSLATALKAFFAANKLPKKNVRLGIASNRIGVRTFEIAGIDDAKQLENAIQFRAQETLPIPLDEAVLDYQILEERVDEEGNSTKRVLLVVAYRELVDRYVAACKKAGITLSGIDLEAFALLRALSAPRPEDQPSDSALVAVSIGHDRSTFAVSDGRVCEFTRVLEWGGASLNIAIARALDLAPSETEGIKRIVSLLSPDVPEGIAPEHYALALDAVRKQVQSFARELVSSLQFYQNQPGSLGIGEIVITGGTANLVGLADELQRLIQVRVRVGDPLARLRVTKKVATDGQLASLAVAIGLGIED